MVDRDDDLAVGIKSTAILFGRHDVLITAMLMAVMIIMLVSAGAWLHLGWSWYAGVAVVAVLFSRQIYQVRDRNRDACFRAFLNNHWVGFTLFVGLLAHFALAGVYSPG